MKSKKQKKLRPPRNWIAVYAHLRPGSGNHGDKKKQASKTACRGRVKWS